MESEPTRVWTCDRCGKTLTLESCKQPPNWSRFYFATPVRSSEHKSLGDLCNECGGDAVDFFYGRDLARGGDHCG
jgi:hypothetical protein